MAETRKLAAIRAADVVGFSRLPGADEDRTLARLRALRSDLIDPTISVHNGRVVKRTGDGALVEFRSVVDAALRGRKSERHGRAQRGRAGRPPRTLRSIARAGESQPAPPIVAALPDLGERGLHGPQFRRSPVSEASHFIEVVPKRSKAGANETQLRPYLQRVIAAAFLPGLAAAFLPGLLAVARSDIAQHRRVRRARIDLGQRPRLAFTRASTRSSSGAPQRPGRAQS